MDSVKQLKAIKSELNTLIRKIDTAIQEQKKKQKDILLTKAEAGRVMGYKSEPYIYRLDIPWNSDGHIMYSKLYQWARQNKPNRLKRMRKNIKGLS